MRLGDVVDKLRVELNNLVRNSPCAACEKLIELAVATILVASIDFSAAPGAGSVPADEALLSKGVALMDFKVVPSGSIPSSAEDGNANAIEKAVADLIGDANSSHPSASRAVNAPFITRSEDDKPMAATRDPPSSGVASPDVVLPTAVPGAVRSKTKSGSGIRSTLLTDQLSVAVASSQTSESTSPPRSGSVGVKCSGSREMLW